MDVTDDKITLEISWFWILKMYKLYREDMGQIKKVAVLPNSLGPDSWEILHWSVLSGNRAAEKGLVPSWSGDSWWQGMR